MEDNLELVTQQLQKEEQAFLDKVISYMETTSIWSKYNATCISCKVDRNNPTKVMKVYCYSDGNHITISVGNFSDMIFYFTKEHLSTRLEQITSLHAKIIKYVETRSRCNDLRRRAERIGKISELL